MILNFLYFFIYTNTKNNTNIIVYGITSVRSQTNKITIPLANFADIINHKFLPCIIHTLSTIIDIIAHFTLLFSIFMSMPMIIVI